MSKPMRLLIVEDSEDDALLLLHTLRKEGYDPSYTLVDDAASMAFALQNQDWDLVISDYTLPRFNGLAALETLQQSAIDIPFIIVSGVIGEETAVAAMKAGAHDYLMKSNMQRLVPAIERELREAEDRRAHRTAEEAIRMLSSALSQSTSWVMITDLSGTIEYLNPTFAHITGLDHGSNAGQDWGFISPETVTTAEQTILANAITRQLEWHGELQTTAENGEIYWVAVSLSPVRNNDGMTAQFLFVAEDITQQKKLEAELQRYNEQLEQMVTERTDQLVQAKEETEVILNTTSDAIALAMPNGDIQKVNPAFNRIFGDKVTEAIEHLLWMLTNEDCIELVGRAFLSVIYDQRDERVEARIQSVDGQAIDADLMFAPVMQSSEQRSGMVFSLRDISHIKEMERFKSAFVAHAAHDLSNPIAAMKMRLHLLKHAPERLNEHLNIIERQINRMEHLVAELRTLSQLDQGQLTLTLDQFDLNTLINDVIIAQLPTAATKSVTLAFKPDVAKLEIVADFYKLERVIVNLIANALNYTPKDGQITLTTSLSADVAVFTVQDTGIGIAQEDIPHIFERFYRTSQVKKSDYTGTGLGLAIVKEMVELHHGVITVSSKIDGGTRFTIQIPRNQQSNSPQ